MVLKIDIVKDPKTLYSLFYQFWKGFIGRDGCPVLPIGWGKVGSRMTHPCPLFETRKTHIGLVTIWFSFFGKEYDNIL